MRTFTIGGMAQRCLTKDWTVCGSQPDSGRVLGSWTLARVLGQIGIVAFRPGHELDLLAVYHDPAGTKIARGHPPEMGGERPGQCPPAEDRAPFIGLQQADTRRGRLAELQGHFGHPLQDGFRGMGQFPCQLPQALILHLIRGRAARAAVQFMGNEDLL